MCPSPGPNPQPQVGQGSPERSVLFETPRVRKVAWREWDFPDFAGLAPGWGHVKVPRVSMHAGTHGHLCDACHEPAAAARTSATGSCAGHLVPRVTLSLCRELRCGLCFMGFAGHTPKSHEELGSRTNHCKYPQRRTMSVSCCLGAKQRVGFRQETGNTGMFGDFSQVMHTA